MTLANSSCTDNHDIQVGYNIVTPYCLGIPTVPRPRLPNALNCQCRSESCGPGKFRRRAGESPADPGARARRPGRPPVTNLKRPGGAAAADRRPVPAATGKHWHTGTDCLRRPGRRTPAPRQGHQVITVTVCHSRCPGPYSLRRDRPCPLDKMLIRFDLVHFKTRAEPFNGQVPACSERTEESRQTAQ